MSENNNSDKTANIVAYRKEYYEKNKEALNEKIICKDCGTAYKKYKKSEHENTKRHKNKVLENENNMLKNIDGMNDKIMLLKSMKDEIADVIEKQKKVFKKFEQNLQ
jgi:hypothetical protein